MFRGEGAVQARGARRAVCAARRAARGASIDADRAGAPPPSHNARPRKDPQVDENTRKKRRGSSVE
jgi:hypothetical protein